MDSLSGQHCIYCGSGSNFTHREYVFPYSLGGGSKEWALIDRVCDKCYQALRPIEAEIANKSVENYSKQDDFNMILLTRAVAKIGFNLMAKLYGDEFVSDPLFADVKDFILTAENSDRAIFKHYIASSSKILEILNLQASNDKHWLILNYLPNEGLFFTLSLYGAENRTIFLGNQRPPADREAFEIASVEYQKRQMKLFSAADIVDLFVAAQPRRLRNIL